MIIDLSGKGEIPTVSLDYQLKREVKPMKALINYVRDHSFEIKFYTIACLVLGVTLGFIILPFVG